MIFHDGFACRRFDITTEGRSDRVEMAGNVIIGLPPRSSSGSIPSKTSNEFSPDSMRWRTYFFLQMTLDYKPTVETQPPLKTESGKRFWVEGQDG
jgi:hypothetical protein